MAEGQVDAIRVRGWRWSVLISSTAVATLVCLVPMVHLIPWEPFPLSPADNAKGEKSFRVMQEHALAGLALAVGFFAGSLSIVSLGFAKTRTQSLMSLGLLGCAAVMTHLGLKLVGAAR